MKAFRLFAPILAGATLRERLIACLGALVGIGLTGLACALLAGQQAAWPLLVAPIGATAVLLFAVPASPLAQPWSIIGGNTLSAVVGILAARWVPDTMLAAGVGVGAAIAVMSLTRCLHPPGGATALTAVLAGPALAPWGLLFPLMPVALNSCLIVAVGMLFHRLSGRRYPHVPPANPHGTTDPLPSRRGGFRDQDVDAALAKLGETFDIDRDDIDRLLDAVTLEAAIRKRADLRCADIMSRDIIAIGPEASRDDALRLLLERNLRILPVAEAGGLLLGTIGLRELMARDGEVRDILSEPETASPSTPALALLPALTDGTSHAIIITDQRDHMVGLITQSDLLSALGREH